MSGIETPCPESWYSNHLYAFLSAAWVGYYSSHVLANSYVLANSRWVTNSFLHL